MATVYYGWIAIDKTKFTTALVENISDIIFESRFFKLAALQSAICHHICVETKT